MRRILLFSLLLTWVAVAQGEQRVALVIGNGAYQDAPLKNPPNDARLMAQALRECGFDIIEKINSDQRTMEDAIRDFGQQIQRGGVGLFYYAGHGMQVQGVNYLIPVGAEVNAEHEVKYEAVDAGRVLSEMEAAGNRLNIIILDACRNNPFARSFRSADRGLKKMDAPTESLLAYATSPGDIASDGTGANGLYTSMLLKHMKQPGIPLEQMFKNVRRDVKEASGGTQVPWEETSLTEEFTFVVPASYEETASQVEALKKRLETKKAAREADSLQRELSRLQRAESVEKASSWLQMNWWVVLLVALVGISTPLLVKRSKKPRRKIQPTKKPKAKVTTEPKRKRPLVNQDELEIEVEKEEEDDIVVEETPDDARRKHKEETAPKKKRNRPPPAREREPPASILEGRPQRKPASASSTESKAPEISSIADIGNDLSEILGPETLTSQLPGGMEMEFVRIDPGTFTMGSPDSEEGRRDNEGPQHEVTISEGFDLGKYQVTQEQWKSAMGTTPWEGEKYVQSNANHPAVYVSWDDVQRFVERLNTAAGKNIYRLPTEGEWEYACRAGTSMRWSFGDDESQLGDYAWYDKNAFDIGEKYAHAVGTKLPNPWGLYDMHGNVWEWCQDWYGDYSSGAQTDPTGPSSGSSRVMRGGLFGGDARGVRSAGRYRASPDDRGRGVGCRLLRTP